MSNWKIPLETGDPSYVLYAPSFCANSIEASIAPKYIVSKISEFNFFASSESNAYLIKMNVSANP